LPTLLPLLLLLQVMSRQFEVIRCCAAYPSFGKTEALVAVMGATDK
jgi:hypothetical protein